MTVKHKLGKTIRYAKNATALNDADLATAVDFRWNDGVEFPTNSILVEEQPNLGHENSFEFPDKPITYESIREEGLTVPMFFRRALDDASEDAPLITFLESAGCATQSYGAATIATYTDAQNIILDANKGALGHAFMVELDNGVHHPVLVAAYDAVTYACRLAMGLPSASQAGKEVSIMKSALPRAIAVPVGDTLGFKVSTRGNHTTADDLAFELRGVALSGIDSITFAPRQSVVFNCKFHVADVAQAASVLDEAAFADGQRYMKLNNMFEFGFGAALGLDAAPGGVVNATKSLINAEVNLGLKVVPVIGEGSSTDLNGIQGYLAYCEQPTVTLRMILDRARFADIEGSNTNKHMHFVQGVTNLGDPAFGLWLPNCYLVDAQAEVFNDDYLTATLTYKATSPRYGTATANGSAGMSPWVLAVNHKDVS